MVKVEIERCAVIAANGATPAMLLDQDPFNFLVTTSYGLSTTLEMYEMHGRFGPLP